MTTKGLVSLIMILLPMFIAHAEDKIILKTGEINPCKIVSVNNDSVDVILLTSNSLFGKKGVESSLPVKDVYMLFYEKRGNVYINKDGQRVSGEVQKLDKSADIIYLLEGAEIPAWDIRIENENVKFQKEKTKKKAFSSLGSVSVSDVFMIVYSDGSKDILNDFREPEPEPEPVKEEPKEVLKVVYHKVAKGETLATVAEKYGVTPEEIQEWNELSKSFKPASRLPINKELIIYQKVIEIPQKVTE